MFELAKINWTDIQAPAALITGAVPLLGLFINSRITARLAKRRAEVDKELFRLRGQIETGLAERRAAVEQELEKLRGEITRGIEDRRRQAEERLTQLKDDLEGRQANRRRFYEKQMELCLAAVDVASRLTSELDREEWAKYRLSFWRLYWGQLSCVEDIPVEKAMVSLGMIVLRQPVNSPDLPMSSAYGQPIRGIYNNCIASRKFDKIVIQPRNR
jgi:hypothetical protein